MQPELLKQIEGKLLYGAKTEIAKKAGVSIFTVLRFFNNDGKRPLNKKVLKATTDYFKEMNSTMTELQQIALS